MMFVLEIGIRNSVSLNKERRRIITRRWIDFDRSCAGDDNEITVSGTQVRLCPEWEISWFGEYIPANDLQGVFEPHDSL